MLLMMALDRLAEVSFVNFLWVLGKFLSSWMYAMKMLDLAVHTAFDAVNATICVSKGDGRNRGGQCEIGYVNGDFKVSLIQ